jgi:hypothetical protein
MFDLIQELLLSNVMIFMAMIVALALVTGWAFRLREIPGYILGWLVGLFFMVALSVMLPAAEPIDAEAQYSEGLNFFGLIIGSGLGLGLGFGVMLLARFGTASTGSARVGRSLTVALLVAITLIASYIMLVSTLATRMSIAVFVLTFGIGATVNYIFSRGMTEGDYSRFSVRNFRDNFPR